MRLFTPQASVVAQDVEATDSTSPKPQTPTRETRNEPRPVSLELPRRRGVVLQPLDNHDCDKGSTSKLLILPLERLLTPLMTPNPMTEDELKMRAFLEEYDPQPRSKSTIPAVWPMSAHREMVRTLFLDNLVHSTARLYRHSWVLDAGSEKYADLQGDRWTEIHNDLMRYTKCLKTYQYWQTSFLNKLNLARESLPHDFETYGRTLAIIEAATKDMKNDNPEKKAMILNLSRSYISSFAHWSKTNAHNRHIGVKEEQLHKMQSRKRALMGRLLAATFGGLTLIIPMLIMVLDTRRLTTILTTVLFTLFIGLILAVGVEDASSKDIIGTVAAYAAVLVVFVGTSGTGT